MLYISICSPSGNIYSIYMIAFMLSKSKQKWKKETKFEWKNIKLVIAEKLSVAQCIIKIIDADMREDEYMEGNNLDSDGKITEYIIYSLKDLRNAVAHNNIIFDTRFRTGKINQRLVALLEAEVGIVNLDFKYIYAYIILLTYVLRKMGESKTTCKQFLNAFISSTDELRNQLPANVCNQILGTQQRSHLKQLQNFISNSW